MANKFPIYRTEATVSGRGPSVRANIDVSTGAGAIGGAISELGGALFDLGGKYALKHSNTEYSKAERDTLIEYDRANLEIKGELDPIKHRQIIEKSHQTILSLRPEDRRAGEAFDLMLNKLAPEWKAERTELTKKRIDDNWYDEAMAKITDIASNGDPNKLIEFEKFLARRQLTDPINKTDATILLMKAKAAQIEGQITLLYRNGNYDEARKLTEASSMTPQEKESMINTINSSEERSKRRAVSLDQTLQEKVMMETVNQMILTPNDVGIEQVEASGLSEQNKAILTGAIIFRTEQLKKDIDPWIENATNKAFTGAISAALDGTREEVVKITVPEIMKQLGNITPEQAGQLINKRTQRLDSNDITNKPAYRYAISTINNIRTEQQKTISAEEFEQNEARFLDIKIALLQYAESISGDPDFDKKIARKQAELTAPVQVEQAESFWGKFWDTLTFTNFPGLQWIKDIPEGATVNPLRKLPLFTVYNWIVLEPDTVAEFEKNIIDLKLTDPEKAKKYYNRHKHLWPERYK